MYLRKYLVALSDHWTFRNSDSWFGTYLSVTPNLYLLLLSHFFPYFSWISLRKPFKGVRKWSLGSGGGSSHSKDGSTSPDSESLQCTPLAQIPWIPFPLINILSDSSVLSLPGCSVDSGRISSQQRYSERRKSAKHLASAGLKCHFIPCLMRFRTVRYLPSCSVSCRDIHVDRKAASSLVSGRWAGRRESFWFVFPSFYSVPDN